MLANVDTGRGVLDVQYVGFSDLFGLEWSGFELKSTPVQITYSLAHS